jgi:hypothetical protein
MLNEWTETTISPDMFGYGYLRPETGFREWQQVTSKVSHDYSNRKSNMEVIIMEKEPEVNFFGNFIVYNLTKQRSWRGPESAGTLFSWRKTTVKRPGRRIFAGKAGIIILFDQCDRFC